MDSLLRQRWVRRGAILVDDASENGLGGHMEVMARRRPERFTVIHNSYRKGLMQNTWEAGDFALRTVRTAYDRDGADMTVGSMLRTDKEAFYPVDFQDPRSNRGGNVWQHLRSFRKYLFDAIRIDDLKLDGEWVEVANDWALVSELPL